jgi:cell wall-associated NlpC family hydrolase
MARSFLYWGESVEPELIQRGDLVVFPRGNSGWQGHVGFFVEERNGQWVILGGNQNNEVRYDLYSPRRALGIRRYPTQEVAGSLPKWMMDKY